MGRFDTLIGILVLLTLGSLRLLRERAFGWEVCRECGSVQIDSGMLSQWL